MRERERVCVHVCVHVHLCLKRLLNYMHSQSNLECVELPEMHKNRSKIHTPLRRIAWEY